ncbi:hypothetical protein [Nonomuraea sp. NPDC050310]|uniref:hypothetical protein n=1 Tax=unclassified Nonomuraea TaxID=2593643 RepID=UPI00340F0F01
MQESAEQLVLDYVARVADAAHGVLRPDQRVDFVNRLRARIERERAGSTNPREVARLLARFGEPRAQVEREVRRLAPAAQPENAAAVLMESSGNTTPLPKVDTTKFPRIIDDVPPGVARSRREAQQRLDRRGRRPAPLVRFRQAAMSTANPAATDGRDAVTILRAHSREVTAMVVLFVAALLVPFNVGELAIFEVPLVVWAVGAFLVLLSETWTLRDKLLGIAAAPLTYLVGGALVAAARLGGADQGFGRFITEFWAYSGIMFMVGTGLGVVRLAYKLLDPA